jgi:tetraacyldisaccharide 4'-kinase
MKKIIPFILLPLSTLYGIILYIRNKFYDWNLFQTTKFNLPIINVGNLAVGGVGKTPHVEYLIRLLEHKNQIATLSRGYKRKTTGFILADKNTTLFDIGDEPLQYHKKFKDLIVAVDEKRVRGIHLLKEKHPDLMSIILDDAFQHRAVNAGLNILITDYSKLYINDFVLPSGRLREWKSGMKRAQIIIISKCDENIKQEEKISIINKINPLPYQKIYFSSIKYGELTPFTNKPKTINSAIDSAIVISGIANPKPLLNKVNTLVNNVKHINFPDHHQFNDADIKKIKEDFKSLKGNNKILITTEKDFMRLSLPGILKKLKDIPSFYIPIEIYFLGNDKEIFDTQIKKYVGKN